MIGSQELVGQASVSAVAVDLPICAAGYGEKHMDLTTNSNGLIELLAS